MHDLFVPDNCLSKSLDVAILIGYIPVSTSSKKGGSPVRVVIPILPVPGFAFNGHSDLCSAFMVATG